MQTPIPPPRPPTAQETVQGVTLPLMLIALGSLYLLDYAGGPGVRQTWPILLILGGCAWALAHMVGR